VPAAAERAGRPNILFVLADDLDMAEMRYLRTGRCSAPTARPSTTTS
jgi:hypothetical protein